MGTKSKIINKNKSRRTFLQNLTKVIASTAVLGGVANILSPIKTKAANGKLNPQLAGEPLLGSIGMAGFNFAPRGWAKCDGQLLSINQNSALFSLLGTIYGGDGESTFALPDMRGRVPMHLGQGSGLTNRQIGQKSGAETNTLITNNLPAHSHNATMSVNMSGGNNDNPHENFLAANSEGIKHYSNELGTLAGSLNAGSISVSNTGGGQSVNNMQPYLVVNFLIALVGIYPSE